MAEIGEILDGKVTGVMNFGAFVSLNDGSSGMVHISEVSNVYVNDIHEHLSVGQEVKVKFLGLNDQGKISLSIKQTMQPIEQPKREFKPKTRRNSTPNVWQGTKTQDDSELSFEDMMSKFKQTSDEKISTLKKSGDPRGGGYCRRSAKRGG